MFDLSASNDGILDKLDVGYLKLGQEERIVSALGGMFMFMRTLNYIDTMMKEEMNTTAIDVLTSLGTAVAAQKIESLRKRMIALREQYVKSPLAAARAEARTTDAMIAGVHQRCKTLKDFLVQRLRDST